MIISKTKKGLSLILAIVMLFTMVPATIFSLGADESYPMMEAYNAASSGDYHKYYNQVVIVNFLDSIDYEQINADDTIGSWDVSANKDYSVMAWMKRNNEETAAAGANRYDVYIAGEGGVGANPDSSHIFYYFSVLKEINGFENFKTDNATTFYKIFTGCSALKTLDMSSFNTSNVENFTYMFSECTSLKSVNLTNWDTSKATNMAYMFNNCHSITEIDLSSFNTANVTNMNRMFYNGYVISKIYVGDGWNIDNVVNGDTAFNCCYLLNGNDNSKTNISYATTSNGGFMTHESEKPQSQKYTVTYSFIGDVIPENVTAPGVVVYEEGAEVTVETSPEAEGYVFSGWSTDDTAISDGEFTINSDVHFVGSWSKLYNVIYKYADGYEVPDDAPELPATVSYKSGVAIDVEDKPFVEGFVFEGWTTSDVDVTTDGKFVMPEKDVVLEGYFRKPVSSVEINNKIDGEIVLNKDETTTIKVTVKPEDATIKSIIYDSGNDEIVIVDEDGNVTAVGPGTTTITVSSKSDPDIKDTVTVTVKIPVTDITVNKNEFPLNKGDKDKIEATVIPEDATNKELTYKSSDETIVKVDENGNIEAVGNGKAEITITSKDNPFIKETVTVTVTTPVESVTVDKTEIDLYVDDTEKITATVNPDDASNKTLIYESDNPGVVKVDNEGNIVAVGSGEATITVKSAENPEINETVTVRVKEKYKVSYKYIGEVPEGAAQLPETEAFKAQDKVTVKDVPAEVPGYRFVGWTTSDVEVSEDGEFTMPEKDIVFEGYFVKKVSDVDITTNEITLNENEEIKLTVEVTPEDAENKELTFESSDESVVKVDKDGNVTAVGEGEATITVTSKDDPTKTDKVTIIVKKPVINVDKVEADKEEITLKVGEKDEIKVTVTPDNATDKTVTFESSDEKVVKVDKDGNIEAVGDGEATITVKTNDGKTDTVKVTVLKEYKVTYEFIGKDIPDGVKAPGEEKFVSGSTVNVKPDFSAEGYVFSGWTTDDAAVKDGRFIINNDVHFVGSWSKLYKVTYIYEGDVPAGAPLLNSYASQHTAGENVTVKDSPYVKGYNFSGWSTTDASVAEGSFTMPAKNVVIKGRFEKVIISVEDITVDRKEITIQNGKKDKITVTVTPDDATNKGVTYKSSDETVVKVDKEGNITAVGIGEATITVTSKADPTKTETVKVTVTKVPVTSITAPEKITIILGQEADITASVNPNATNKGLTYTSEDEAIVKVDANGKLTSVGEGTTKVIVRSLDNPDIYAEIKVEVKIKTGNNTEHYMVFGKTEKIGWYSVSFDGGETFQTVFGNSNLVVKHGTVAIIKANDIMGDPFTFYINGKAVTPDENGYVTVKVDGYVLVGALGIPVIAPDVEESLNFIQRIIKAIKDFFAKIVALFKK